MCHLFPYALQVLPSTLATQWDSSEFQPYRDVFPAEYRSSPALFDQHVRDLMAKDLKVPYLKSLQGYLWLRGYKSGELRCPLFADVFPALASWHAASIPILIYSSGSVPAQKLLFQYTNSKPDADIRALITDYFDTVNAGPKTEPTSYEKIASAHREIGEISSWLFLSDNVKEVYAAKEAGMQSLVVVRDGNAPLSEDDKAKHETISSFDQIDILKK
ncbi:hypothetical protein B7463_g529, partial [Scytalidium lignicola]